MTRDPGLTLPCLCSPPDADGSAQEIDMTTSIGRFAGIALFTAALALSAPAMAYDNNSGSSNNTTIIDPPPGPTTHNSGPTLSVIRADIVAQNWTKAIADLKVFLKANSKSADGWNLLGYSYRNHGDLKLADGAYDRALKLNPNLIDALSYQGILYIKLGETSEAQDNLAKIKTICGNTTCPQYVALSKALN
jgi:tetratricopeptide (TPR) repeat protein